ncbi:MAG TPA: Uma2 family endonuclease [Ardenticatenaceae bacterium]|nr:Uma2 family endonuclease [Ardenticatenaceae bacterium]
MQSTIERTTTMSITTLLTAEDFLQLSRGDARLELIRGEVIDMSPPGARHGIIALEFGSRLRAWAKSGPGGYTDVESGFVLNRNPDTVRGPDVAYVSQERVPATGVPMGYWPIAPDLAVEVVSPDETADEVRDKVRDYLSAGTRLVLVLYPRTREIIAHTPDGLARTSGPGDVFEHPDVLPGFTCPVGELFPD